MPQGEACDRKCPLCAVKLRSDNLRRHLLTHQSLLTDDTPETWRRVPGKLMFVKYDPAVPGVRAERPVCAVCLDCVAASGFPRLIQTTTMKRSVDTHICKAKQERAARKPRTPGTTPTATTASKDSDDEEEEMPVSPAERLLDQLRQRMLKKPRGVLSGEAYTRSIQRLYAKMGELYSNATDEETGKVDYDEVLVELMGDMYMSWLSEQMAEEMAAARPPATPATPAPIAPAMETPAEAAGGAPGPATPLRTVGFKIR